MTGMRMEKGERELKRLGLQMKLKERSLLSELDVPTLDNGAGVAWLCAVRTASN